MRMVCAAHRVVLVFIQSRRTPARGGLFLEGTEKEPHNTTRQKERGERNREGFFLLCVCCATTRTLYCDTTENPPARKGIIAECRATATKKHQGATNNDEPAHTDPVLATSSLSSLSLSPPPHTTAKKNMMTGGRGNDNKCDNSNNNAVQIHKNTQHRAMRHCDEITHDYAPQQKQQGDIPHHGNYGIL